MNQNLTDDGLPGCCCFQNQNPTSCRRPP